MADLRNIKLFSQQCAKAIAAILEVEVTITDQECIRIAGTGIYEREIGKKVPHTSFFRQILNTGNMGMIKDVKKEFGCKKCEKNYYCLELANIGFPIYKGDEIIGVIGIIAFSDEQREILISSIKKIREFIKYINELFISKILLLEANMRINEEFSETMQNYNSLYSFDSIIGRTPDFLKTINKAKKVSDSLSTVMIRGESGTGKEILARAIHFNSKRRNKPFIAINCSSIPENLIESELFGYEEGAFTDAKKGGKLGKFELANGGTLFLDEVGDMSLTMQAKLLRVLQDKKVTRIGGRKAIPLDLRIISATNKELENMLQTKEFREDLYYRLNVIPLYLRPLRQRREDILLLANYYLDKICKNLSKKKMFLDEYVKKWFYDYEWPGNIRQLINVIEYAVNMCETNLITLGNLPEYIFVEKYQKENIGLEEMLEKYEKEILKKYIDDYMSLDKKKEVAEKLKISTATLYRKLKKYDL
ncbi:sigma-54 interaction domain-containing protein [Paramaledivibacter caminithermalis]|jgi:transcriptional regulator with PAS, ATPase and Fis domain|uniref:HTH-type transcriptional regulatory protein TyrR n=1 Tax=Paramaledivibacter caminithermalis (strain DSM 15212 / CIP 107654 / DViRD3) TaxID=1121301 RepID=A0A1M6R315_PARC5|nr:sigma 54-interacting transcriptional regulator [Paramaledivibacter caminithermalis]SHK26718.1 Transcriptional regulator containing PAS, AAA-type ATPase, and DNA-binding Fis domains [Paramaledivibacter caminithermalis DSM 15212]